MGRWGVDCDVDANALNFLLSMVAHTSCYIVQALRVACHHLPMLKNVASTPMDVPPTCSEGGLSHLGDAQDPHPTPTPSARYA